jgi:H+-translocating diphosphatase
LLVRPKATKKKTEESDQAAQDTKIEIKDDENQLVKNEENLNNSQRSEPEITESEVQKLELISSRISEGANIFLLTEYLYLLIFIVGFAILIFLVGEHKRWMAYTTIAFILGSLTSILCGWIGMRIATASNYRTTYSA